MTKKAHEAIIGINNELNERSFTIRLGSRELAAEGEGEGERERERKR